MTWQEFNDMMYQRYETSNEYGDGDSPVVFMLDTTSWGSFVVGPLSRFMPSEIEYCASSDSPTGACYQVTLVPLVL